MEPFVGSGAIADGTVTRGVLRARYTAILPDIYIRKDARRTLDVRARAAWLWSGKTGIIAGRTAAGLYRKPWVVTTDPVEMIARSSKHPPGLIIRNERIAVDEITVSQGLPVTAPVRTALDLARHLDRDEAVVLLDQFAQASGITQDDIWALAARYPGARGIATANEAILLMDPKAETPQESRVRLLLAEAGLHPTHSQIRITDGHDETVVAMGWLDQKVGVDCDFLEYLRFPFQAVTRADLLQRLGWLHIQVLPQDTLASVAFRTRTALWSRRQVA